MKDSLRDVMLERTALEVPEAPTGLPTAPPAKPARVPPAWQRYSTGLKMQHAYANGWSPNPMLIRILDGSK